MVRRERIHSLSPMAGRRLAPEPVILLSTDPSERTCDAILKKTAITFCFMACGVVTHPLPASPQAAGGELPTENELKPVEMVRTNDYTEGVVVDHEGNLYFSHEKIVTKVTPDGKASTWAETGAPNGHKVLADGTHLICDASRHALLHLDAVWQGAQARRDRIGRKAAARSQRPDARHCDWRRLFHRPGELGPGPRQRHDPLP